MAAAVALGFLAANGAPGEDAGLSSLSVGNNADGRLEIFQVRADGELRHRWQRESLHDWSAWSSLGGHFCPGVTVVQDDTGRLWVFVVDQASRLVEYSFQRSSNSLSWSAWSRLSGQAVEPPVTAGLGPDGKLHVFAVGAGEHSLKHIWQSEDEAGWSGWSDLGGALAPGPVAARNVSGELEIFGLSATDNSLVHCWQTDPAAPEKWSPWSDLGARILPGFVTAQNADGRLEVFGVSAADGNVGHLFQVASGAPAAWSRWLGLGAKMKPGIAWGRNLDGRIEIFTVSPTNGMIFHSFQNRGGATTNWAGWTDMSLVGGLGLERKIKRTPQWARLSDMGALTRSRPVVGTDLEGHLEVFAFDEGLNDVVNHRRQIAGNLNWVDWSSLDSSTAQYLTRAWRIDDGLPDNRVQAIAQTADGYIWVGTRKGLAKFDGVRFETLDLKPILGSPNASITCLLVDRDGALWIGSSQAGLARLAGRHITHFSRADGLAGNSVTALCESKDRSLWIGTTAGLSHCQDRHFSNLTARDGLVSDSVESIAEDSDGSLWVTTGAGLSQVQGKTVRNFTQADGLPDDSLRGVWQDVPGRLWIGSNRGLIFYRGSKFFAYDGTFGLSDRLVNVIRSDSQGNVWVGAGSGLNRFQDGAFIEELDAASRSLGSVDALFEDREGNLWAGSQNGLFRLSPKKLLLYDKRQGLARDNVNAVIEDLSGSLWIATAGGGLNQLRDQAITAFAPPEKSLSDQALSLCVGKDGGLWMGGDCGGGLTHLKDGASVHFGRPEGLASGTVRVICEDRAGHVWAGTAGGLSCLEAGRFVTNPIVARLAGRNVRAICEDKQNGLWFGTDDGLVRWRDGQASVFTTKDGLSENRVTALYEDEARTLWIGTERSGLNRYDNATGRFLSYSTRQGLFSDEILEILEDDLGWLWMTSPQGVFRVRKSDFASVDYRRLRAVTSIAYGHDDGMASVSCGAGKPGGWKTRDGELWFPTSEGLVAIDPRIVNVNPTPPPVYIEGLMANAKPLALPEAPGAPLRIAPGQNELEFHYTALSFQKPERIRFRYKLDGVDADWMDAGTRRAAYYNNLPPGRYSFHVMACNSDGIWNQQGASLDLALLPHVWETWWFRILAVSAILALVAAAARQVTRSRMQRKLERLERQHAVERERMRIAHDIHDDLGGSLTQITFLGEMAKRDLGKPAEAARHMNKITESARQTARALDEIVWAVHPEHDRLDHLTLYLWQFAEEFFQATPVRCRVEAPAEMPACFIPADMRHGIYLVVKEAFNNTLKHATASEVRLRFSFDHSVLAISIEDNGRGFAVDPSVRFNDGLDNMKRRVEEFHGQFSIASRPGNGTQLRFSIPLSNAHAN
jgi:ligand-binding sensor domain-containing protein/signal transduction histidine kinase